MALLRYKHKTWRQCGGHIAAMMHRYLRSAIWWLAAELTPALSAILRN